MIVFVIVIMFITRPSISLHLTRTFPARAAAVGFACASEAHTRSSKIRFDPSVCACHVHAVVHTTKIVGRLSEQACRAGRAGACLLGAK